MKTEAQIWFAHYNIFFLNPHHLLINAQKNIYISILK